MTYAIDAHELDELRTEFHSFNRKLLVNLGVTNETIAKKAVKKAKQFAPKKTGALRAAIIYLKVKRGDYRIISKAPIGSRRYNGVGYNVLQEYGVRKNSDFGFLYLGNGKGMMIPVKGNEGKIRPHRGIKAKRFMYKTWLWLQKEYPERVETTVSQTIKNTFK